MLSNGGGSSLASSNQINADVLSKYALKSELQALQTASLRNNINYNTSILNAPNEYLYWSQYGKLVVVDFGGVSGKSTGFGLQSALTDLPVMRTRPVVTLLNDDSQTVVNNRSPILFYGVLNGTTMNCHVLVANVRGYGQVTYMTD